MFREGWEQWVDERSLSSNQHQTSDLCRFLIAITVCLYPYCLESPQTFSLLNINVVCCCTNESTHKTCCKLLFPLKFYFGKIRVKNKVCFTFVLRDPSWLSPNRFNVQQVRVCGTPLCWLDKNPQERGLFNMIATEKKKTVVTAPYINLSCGEWLKSDWHHFWNKVTSLIAWYRTRKLCSQS